MPEGPRFAGIQQKGVTPLEIKIPYRKTGEFLRKCMGISALCHFRPEQNEASPKNERKPRLFTALRSVQNDKIAFLYTF